MRALVAGLIFLLSLAAPLMAADKPVLTVYTYESFTAEWGPGPAVQKAFEAQCGCEVKYVSLADGVALLTRLKAEGKNTQADVVLGLDTNLTAEAQATGLFDAHGHDVKGLALPIAWDDKTFLPFDWAHFAVVYDSDKLKNPPKSLDELVNGPEDEKIVIEDPRTSTPGLGLLLWMKQVYGDKAGEAWAKLSRRVLTVTPGWSEAYGLFTKGEAPMVLSYTTSPAYHVIAENSTRYKAAEFAEGHYMQVEVAGVVKGAKQEKLARDFLAFMISPAFQDIIPQTNWMFPAAATSAPLPQAFNDLVKPAKSLLYSPQQVADNRKAWTDEWLAAMGK